MRVFWIAWPRTGSTWAAQVLAELIGWPCHEYERMRPVDEVVHCHLRVGEFKDQIEDSTFKRVVGIRDPRDAIVSHYYMACHSNPKFSPENLSILQYVQWYFLGEKTSIRMPHCSFAQFYREWLAENVDAWVRHEDLLADQRGEFLGIAEMLGEGVVGDVDAILKRFNSYRQYEYDDAYLRGELSVQTRLPGRSTWPDYLGEEELALIYETTGELMHHFGYEW